MNNLSKQDNRASPDKQHSLHFVAKKMSENVSWILISSIIGKKHIRNVLIEGRYCVILTHYLGLEIWRLNCHNRMITLNLNSLLFMSITTKRRTIWHLAILVMLATSLKSLACITNHQNDHDLHSQLS